jgi:hypothetical protein
VWQKSDQSDKLDGLENDPVISLLITALAYQANETESELEQMKADVLEEFSRTLTPYDVGHAIPASIVVETALSGNVQEMDIDASSVFTLKDSQATLLPLLHTRLLNATVRQITRVDGKRWKVSLTFKSPVADLSGFCFAIRGNSFRDVTVSIGEQALPLIKPWDFGNLPLSPCFGIDTVLYNHTHTLMASSIGLDLFACQNVRLFCISRHPAAKIRYGETDTVDLMFEFSGISEDFVFDESQFSLNAVVLVNAQQHTVTLSAASPIARVAGYDSQTADATAAGRQFMHILRPSDEQMYGDIPIEVRRIAADRFNQGTLLKLLDNLINKYYSDYYAFQNIQDAATDKVVYALTGILSQLQQAASRDEARSISGVYLMLRPPLKTVARQTTVDVTYVTTQGAAVNGLLKGNFVLVPPTGLDGAATRQISELMPGADEIRDAKSEASLRRYYMTTHDRLVTPADIRLFCYYELQTRYGISKDMVRDIIINHRQQPESRLSGYEIFVGIELVENTFIRRGFAEKIPQTEMLMQRLMQVRSANIYPFRVSITIR